MIKYILIDTDNETITRAQVQNITKDDKVKLLLGLKGDDVYEIGEVFIFGKIFNYLARMQRDEEGSWDRRFILHQDLFSINFFGTMIILDYGEISNSEILKTIVEWTR